MSAKRKGIATVVVGGAILMGIASCSSNSSNSDLTGITYNKPDKIEGYNNVDGQPNLTRLCIGGVAFMTTSRDQNAVLRVPEWDTWCPKASPK